MLLEEWQLEISRFSQIWPKSPKELPAILAGNEQALQLLGTNTLLEASKSLKELYPKTCLSLKKYLNQGDAAWHDLVQQFMKTHLVTSHKMQLSLSNFCQFLKEDSGLMLEYPWLPDLARFESLLNFVFTLSDTTPPPKLVKAIPAIPDFHFYQPVPNDAKTLFQSTFPILEIHEYLDDPEFDIKNGAFTEGPVSEFLIYRDPDTLRPKVFSFSNELSMALLMLCEETLTYAQLLETLLQKEQALQKADFEMVQQNARDFFDDCLKNNVLLGSIPASQEVSPAYSI